MALTDEQKQPISSEKDHQLILAGPGTGKSFTILGYINHLIKDKGIDPPVIVVITFTRAAANELKAKIRAELNTENLPKVSTLHSFSLRQLMRNSGKIASLPIGFSIANDFEERYIIMEDIKRMIGAEKIKDVVRLFNLLSANWETLNIEKGDWEFTFDNPQFLGAWQEHRTIYGYMLRAELVYQLKKALEQDDKIQLDNPIEYLVVDEYQDLNKCDLAIIEHLRKRGAKIFCAGDDDQSIYGFRYAYPEGIRNFVKEVENSAEFKLTECFRCDEVILSLALHVIGQDPKRIPKKLKSMSNLKGEYHLLRFDNQYRESEKIASIIRDLIEKKDISANDIIVLLRTNYNGTFSQPIIECLTKLGIPINDERNSLSAFEESSGRYFLSVLKFFQNPEHDLALRTILELTPGLGTATFTSVYDLAKAAKARFHKIIGQIQKGEITEVKNLKKLLETLNRLYELREVLKHEENIGEALARLKEFIPNFSEGFSEKIKTIIETKKLRNITELIEYTDDLLGPNAEAPDETINGIRIMSMHQAKGLTAKAVFIVAAEEEYSPGKGDIDEERRLFYVSITRAKHFLWITYCNDRIQNQQHSGYLVSKTTRRNLTRYLRDLPVIKPEDGHAFQFK